MPQTVLSVDADDAVRRLRNESLRLAGFEVVEAATGTDALKLVSVGRPALVVLATGLPGMDGFEVAKRLKADPRTAFIPVLHIAGRGEPHAEYAASLESGADAYLQEPVEPPALVAVATALIRSGSGAAGANTAQLQAILDSAPVAILIAHDPQCLRITGNAYVDQVIMQTGRGRNISRSAPSGEDAVKYRVFCHSVEKRAEDLPAQVAAATGQPVPEDSWDLVFPDGRTVHLLMGAVPLFDAEGRVRGSVAAGVDVTRHKRAEDALRESEAVLRSFYDSPGIMRGIVEVVEGRGVHVSCNAAAAEMFGLDRESIAGKTPEETGTPEDIANAWIGLYEESRRTGELVSMEYKRRDAAGRERWLLASVSYLPAGSSGNPRFAYAILDLTGRKRAEDALRESEERFRTMADGCPTIIWVTDADGGNRFVNRTYLDFFGVAYEDVEGGKWHPLVHPDDARKYIRTVVRAVRERTAFSAEARVQRADGEWRWIASHAEPRWSPGGKFLGHAGISQDITERKRAEESLRESEKREHARAVDLEALMDAAPAAILIAHDPECRIISGNRMAYDLLHLQPGSNLSRSAPGAKMPGQFRMARSGLEIQPRELPVQQAALTGQPVRDFEMELVFEDGASVSLLGDAVPMLDEDGRPRGAVGVFVDITERKRAEERLRQAQKLESLGLLAGGVAHDFNNLLVGVIGNASLAQDMLPPDHSAIELLEGVIKTGEQAAHLTRQMLAYSGKGKFLVELLNLSALIPDMSGLIRPSISKNIDLRLDLEQGLPAVEADRGQVQQVFMNLALNAAEAIGSHDGVVTVRTGVQKVDSRYLRLHPEAVELHPGEYVFLEVRDNGCGMDEATRARIFDPFFSTKFTGRGLGLAAVAGIVRGHRGTIVVETAPGKGSCLTVLFPAAARSPDSEAPAAAHRRERQGAGVVLVVDDEKIVRDMAKRALERDGYTVLVAEGGPEAIDVCKRHPGDIALLILDLSMPHMSGEEALLEIRKIRPEVKVVVSSGYSEAESMTVFKGQQVSGFIQKPYTAGGIAEKVKSCLG